MATKTKTTIADFKKAIRQDGTLNWNTEHRNPGRALIYIQNQITFAARDGQITEKQAESLHRWSHDHADVVASRIKSREKQGKLF